MKLFASTLASICVLGAAALTSLNGTIEKTDNIQREYVESIKPETTTEATTEATTYTIYDTANIPAKERNWYFMANNNHTTPEVQGGIDYKKYRAYYVGDTSQKRIYLTFDEGYENGYTAKILDVLKEKDVKAAFFCTGHYLKSNPELIKRMVAEGHIVGNHGYKHINQTTIGEAAIIKEINDCEYLYKQITGSEEMPKYFRPPEGAYTEKSLAVTNNMGYKSIFWTFAYKDWIAAEQPGKQAAYNKIINGVHNGAIYLLHAVSASNTEALPMAIDTLREQGYTFGTLDELN